MKTVTAHPRRSIAVPFCFFEVLCSHLWQTLPPNFSAPCSFTACFSCLAPRNRIAELSPTLSVFFFTSPHGLDIFFQVSQHVETFSARCQFRDLVQETGSTFSTGNHSVDHIMMLFFSPLLLILFLPFMQPTTKCTIAAPRSPILRGATLFHNQPPAIHAPTNCFGATILPFCNSVPHHSCQACHPLLLLSSSVPPAYTLLFRYRLYSLSHEKLRPNSLLSIFVKWIHLFFCGNPPVCGSNRPMYASFLASSTVNFSNTFSSIFPRSSFHKSFFHSCLMLLHCTVSSVSSNFSCSQPHPALSQINLLHSPSSSSPCLHPFSSFKIRAKTQFWCTLYLLHL